MFYNVEQYTFRSLVILVLLSFQAVHCKLADVEPVNKEAGWSPEVGLHLSSGQSREICVIFVNEKIHS